MTVESSGFVVEAGTGRPTRIALQNVWFKALSSDTNGDYTLGEYALTYDIPPHIHHGEDEAIYVLEGRLSIGVGDDTFVVGHGDFVFLPRNVPHSITLVSEKSARFLAISTPGGFEHFMEDLTEVSVAGHDRSSPEWAEVQRTHGRSELNR